MSVSAVIWNNGIKYQLSLRTADLSNKLRLFISEVLLSFFCLLPDLPIGRFPWDFRTKIWYALLASIRATCAAHRNLFHSIFSIHFIKVNIKNYSLILVTLSHGCRNLSLILNRAYSEDFTNTAYILKNMFMSLYFVTLRRIYFYFDEY